MKGFLVLLVFFLLQPLFSCKKNANSNFNIAGHWTWFIQYADNPAFNATPASTGIQEFLEFTTNNTYSLSQNGVVINTGTYRTGFEKSIYGKPVSAVYYSNARVRDSVSYFGNEGNDTLFFSHDLIGTVGSGSRCYKRN